ncbi:MAG: chromosomal replication initiator protein DnaA [Thermodesulfobacteriota bacterium]
MSGLFSGMMNRLEQELPRQDFQRWMVPLKFHEQTAEALVIQVPNIFFKTWILDNYRAKLRRIISELAGREMELELIIASTENATAEPGPRSERVEPSQKSTDKLAEFDTGLMEKYTFTNFVVGSSNQLAHAASMAVANRSAAYNPLFLYGGSGLGKTHLINAIGNHLLLQDMTLKVVYRSSEEFTNELIEALRMERMSIFRQKYRNIDALLIDDIHFIGGKERTQEEFFYTFNALYESEKQIVLSSDKMPKDIPDLEDRLRSRFEGGLFADISPPDQETKVAILFKKAEEEGITLSAEVGFYLASQKETNIRVLEGYLARLGAYSSLTRKPIDLDTAQKLLGLFIESDQSQITLDLILKVTGEYFNLKLGELKSGKKQKAIALPRQAAMYMARQMTNLSTIEIGQRMGGRDHSTVIHAVKKIEGLMEQDHSFARTIEELKRKIRTAANPKES